VGEIFRLSRAVGARADRGLDPGEEIGGATGGVLSGGRGGVAVELLIHLKEPMRRARVIGVVGVLRRGDLEGAGRKMAGVPPVVRNALIRTLCFLPRAARQ